MKAKKTPTKCFDMDAFTFEMLFYENKNGLNPYKWGMVFEAVTELT